MEFYFVFTIVCTHSYTHTYKFPSQVKLAKTFSTTDSIVTQVQEHMVNSKGRNGFSQLSPECSPPFAGFCVVILIVSGDLTILFLPIRVSRMEFSFF